MTVVAGLSLLPRILATLAFRPALFTPDSFGYLSEGVHLTTGSARTAGYPVLLRVLEPFHSLLVVTSVQHLMGVATGVLVYAVLRHWGLPSWGAVLAACPTLFDSREIMVESAILPDTLYTLLIVLAVAFLLSKRKPTVLLAAMAGLAVAWASLARGNGATEMVGVLAALLIWRTGWRKVVAATAGFALPLLAYMGVFYLGHGQFALTNSAGFFIWSRTMSFANCAVIKPPPDLLPLCPDAQPHHPAAPTPAWSFTSLLHARSPADYLWDSGVWWRHDAHPGINAANNALATQFAVDAIRAQPVAYLRTVGSGVMLTFLATDRSLSVRSLHFTPVPDVASLQPAQARYLHAYAHITTNTHAVQPFAYLLYLYQEPVYFTGIMFLLVILAGLAGVIRNWRRRGGPVLLPWFVAAIGIIAPVALHEYHYRYALPAVPVACLAAGLAFARDRAQVRKAPVTATPAATATTEALPRRKAITSHVKVVPPKVPPGSGTGLPAAGEPGGQTTAGSPAPEG